MIINKKYRKWLPIPIIVGIVIIQSVAIQSILGFLWQYLFPYYGVPSL
ncbi:hypothetical protein BACFRA24663_06635 [Bacteroides fragilis]